MKRILLLLLVLLMTQFNVYASEYTAEEAVDILVPYGDEHIMTRNECMKAMNRIIGINDAVTISYLYEMISDYYPKKDIFYDSYKGRFTDRGIYVYDRIIPSRDRWLFMGDEEATKKDVLLWMDSLTNRPEKAAEGEANLIRWSINVGLITDEATAQIHKSIRAKDFKMLINNFFDFQAAEHYDFKYTKGFHRIHDSLSYSDMSYLELFNYSYTPKDIHIKNNGIYIGNDKTNYKNPTPFVDETGTMLMPVRWLAAAFGFDNIEWDEVNNAVILSEYKYSVDEYKYQKYKMKFVVGSSEYEFVDSYIKPYDFGISAQIIDGSMYVTMRSVCESLMYDVNWEVE